MTNLKLIKGGNSKEDSKAPDYFGVGLIATLTIGLTAGFWMLKFFFETITDSPERMIQVTNHVFIGFSLAALCLVGVALGKEMTNSSNKYTVLSGIFLFWIFVGLFIYTGFIFF